MQKIHNLTYYAKSELTEPEHNPGEAALAAILEQLQAEVEAAKVA